MKLKFVERNEFYSTFSLTSQEAELASDFIEADYVFGDFEVLCSYYAGCMIIRYYSDDVGYHFEAPFPLSTDACEADAFVAISEYCKAEAIPETVIGIAPALLDAMLRGAKRYSASEDEDGTYAVRIVTECMECEFLPEALCEDLYLGEFADCYADKYEELLKNENLNCHFGYNILDDIPNGTGMDFIKSAREEFERAESMTFAATIYESGRNVFVGEGTLYAFDGRGSACASFRVLPEFHRRGIGTKIFKALMNIAKDIGLERLIAEVKPENKASLALLSALGEPVDLGEKIRFVFEVQP